MNRPQINSISLSLWSWPPWSANVCTYWTFTCCLARWRY